jgi:polar amino acid transport system substrate-binding protein
VTTKADTAQPLTFHPIFPPTSYHVAFRDTALCDDFNRGLKHLRDSGEYDRIVARYARYLGTDARGLSR